MRRARRCAAEVLFSEPVPLPPVRRSSWMRICAWVVPIWIVVAAAIILVARQLM
jgi:hypothetical protein